MKDFIKKYKKTIDIYIIIILTTIIIAMIFIIFPEITKNNFISTQIELYNKKQQMDNYFTNKIIEHSDFDKKEENIISEELNKSEEIIEENLVETSKEEIIEKEPIFILKQNDNKLYKINETFILNFRKNQDPIKIEDNNIIMNNNEIQNVACLLTDFNFDINEYKLNLTFNFKNLSKENIKIDLNKFYIRYKDEIIINNENENILELKEEEEKDNKMISFIFDKNLSIEDLNLSFIDICYKDELNIRNLNLIQ